KRVPTAKTLPGN
ncbi:type II secretion system protein J, partial [Vibrio parahaemolyticus V-223/04]